MFKVLIDLLRYNKEFLLGTILISIILALIVASVRSPTVQGNARPIKVMTGVGKEERDGPKSPVRTR
ncbi:hypothetical protein ACC680_37075, partial [Rhizobium ruizarguesonis]